jgi:flagellar hook-associated protein 1 FlgK
MSGLFSALSTNTRALQVHSLGAEVTGKNLANVNNPNYARQRANVTNLSAIQTEFGSMSMGLTVEGLSHSRDRLLDDAMLRELGLQGSLEAQREFATRMESSLGEMIDRSDSTSAVDGTNEAASSPGLSGALNRYFNALDEVAANPTDPVQKNLLLEASQALVDEFHNVDARMADLRADGVAQGTDEAVRVNELFSEVADINRQITRFELKHPESAVDLRDKRQAALEELSGLVDFTTSGTGGDLQIHLTEAGTGNPVAAVDGQDVVADFNYGAPGTYTLGGASINLSSGSIQGRDSMITGALANTQADLDELSAELVNGVNAAYNPASDAGMDFFSSGGITAANISLDANLSANFRTSASGNASDATLILNTARLADQDTTFDSGATPAFNGTFVENAANLAASIGSTASGAASKLETQQLVTDQVRSQRDSVSGVSMDEETANLIKYQRAFEASAKVVSVIDELLNVVVNQLKR